MRLEFLCEMELAYRESTFGSKFVFVKPYGTDEGSGYGEGEGTVTGEKIRGAVRFVNHSHVNSGGSFQPNVDGIIKTEDGALIHLKLRGRTVEVGGMGQPLLSAIFESGDDRYKWLNNTFCVVEGKIDFHKFVIFFRVYSCISDLL